MVIRSSILSWRIPWTEGPGRPQPTGCRVGHDWVTNTFTFTFSCYSVGKRKKVKSVSRVWLFATPWTVAYQAPPSMGFSRQEYWSGLPFPSPGIFPTQGSNLGLPHSGRRFTVWATRETLSGYHSSNLNLKCCSWTSNKAMAHTILSSTDIGWTIPRQDATLNYMTLVRDPVFQG